MYNWYKQSRVCYVYLSDVDPSDKTVVQDFEVNGLKAAFCCSRWFSRGWTLQELIAPGYTLFFDARWEALGALSELQHVVVARTGIHRNVFESSTDLNQFSVAQRMSWASGRNTTRPEDESYCLLGIFGINMPLLYGEGRKAFTRLQEEIIKANPDHSILAWDWSDGVWDTQLLASSPSAFQRCGNIVEFVHDKLFAFSLTNIGLQGTFVRPLDSFTPRKYGDSHSDVYAILNCVYEDDFERYLSLPLSPPRGDGVRQVALTSKDRIVKLPYDEVRPLQLLEVTIGHNDPLDIDVISPFSLGQWDRVQVRHAAFSSFKIIQASPMANWNLDTAVFIPPDVEPENDAHVDAWMTFEFVCGRSRFQLSLLFEYHAQTLRLCLSRSHGIPKEHDFDGVSNPPMWSEYKAYMTLHAGRDTASSVDDPKLRKRYMLCQECRFNTNICVFTMRDIVAERTDQPSNSSQILRLQSPQYQNFLDKVKALKLI